MLPSQKWHSVHTGVHTSTLGQGLVTSLALPPTSNNCHDLPIQCSNITHIHPVRPTLCHPPWSLLPGFWEELANHSPSLSSASSSAIAPSAGRMTFLLCTSVQTALLNQTSPGLPLLSGVSLSSPTGLSSLCDLGLLASGVTFLSQADSFASELLAPLHPLCLPAHPHLPVSSGPLLHLLETSTDLDESLFPGSVTDLPGLV